MGMCSLSVPQRRQVRPRETCPRRPQTERPLRRWRRWIRALHASFLHHQTWGTAGQRGAPAARLYSTKQMDRHAVTRPHTNLARDLQCARSGGPEGGLRGAARSGGEPIVHRWPTDALVWGRRVGQACPHVARLGQHAGLSRPAPAGRLGPRRVDGTHNLRGSKHQSQSGGGHATAMIFGAHAAGANPPRQRGLSPARPFHVQSC